MEKFFNTAGPMRQEMNYYISSFDRIDYDEIENLINQQRYFVLHAPRQTGKTSALFEMMDRINSEGKYDCLYVNVEPSQADRNDAIEGAKTICSVIANAASFYLGNDTLSQWIEDNPKITKNTVGSLIRYWVINNPKPIVLFIDEIDALVGDNLISLLRQIRSGYNQRPQAFPISIILCGVRDVRDYRIHTKDNEIITGGSAFNIKAKSLTIGNFTFDECKKLYLQHTSETGQKFEESIFPKLWSDTKGQPWLVNAMGYQLTWDNETLREDRTKLITLEHYKEAREILIHSRATHLDQIVDKLQEPRVRSVISAILSGENINMNKIKTDDLEYVSELGLVEIKPMIKIANDIYKETIPRELTWTTQVQITNEQQCYIKEDNSIDMIKLLKAFQEFFRINADSWIEKFDYKESGPQLLLQAFLQRIINGGGRINREYGLGRKRTDIFIEWPLTDKGFWGEVQKVVIETKILHTNSLETTIKKGVTQTLEYKDIAGAKESYLIIFNRDENIKWEDKIWNKKDDSGVMVWGA